MANSINRNVKMFKKSDGRWWSSVECESIMLEMLWDTGASVTVMSEGNWRKCGCPALKQSPISLKGAFGVKSVACVGEFIAKVRWNGMSRDVQIMIVRDISPSFVGGMNLIRSFGMTLGQTCPMTPIASECVGIRYSNTDRSKRAMEIFCQQPKRKLSELIIKYSTIFMASEFDLGCTNLVKHSIRTKGDPISQNPRRMAMQIETKVDEMIIKLLEMGIIRKCRSPWNSPIVVVGKKDGSIRLCQDFRKINEITEKFSFPMADPQTIFDSLSGASMFSSLDLGQAYYQVYLDETSQLKTAFSTKKGQFCYNRMPFGLCTAPATFQSLMHILFDDILYNGVAAYLDDVLVYGRTVEEHDKNLEEVFKRIKNAGLRINPKKCSLYQSELVFLGHKISADGISTNDVMVKKIIEAEIPKCTKQLRSFLGLANYYRKFVPNFAQVAKPLYEATKGHVKDICWNKECEDSFRELKHALVHSPILAFPNKDDYFILDTDACFSGIGAVLSQVQEGHEKVIAYGSRLLSAHEKGYCVTRKELLAIYEYVVYFRHYLYGKRFDIRTDHRALQFLKSTSKPISPQFQTWLSELSGYDFELKYRKGENHNNADGLSRILISYCSQCQREHDGAKSETSRIRFLNAIKADDFNIQVYRNAQENDPVLSAIKKYILDSNSGIPKIIETSPYFGKLDNLLVLDDLLLFVDEEKQKLVVPRCLMEKLVKHIHKELCHLGVKKTINYMNDHFFWINMVTEIKTIIKRCDLCMKRKTVTAKTAEYLIPRVAIEPMEQLVIDIAHMRETKSRNRYLVVIIDQFSKMISLTPTQRQDEKTIHRVLLHHWIYKFGKPKYIVSDRGKVFEGSQIKDLVEKYNIQWIFTSPYDHKSNGLAERAIRTIRDMIVTFLNDGRIEGSWDEIMPKIEYSLNSTVQESTGFSPMEIIFGRKVNIHGKDAYVNLDHKQILTEVRNNLRLSADKMRTRDIEKKGHRVFEIDQKVLVKIDPQKRAKDGNVYEGPVKIKAFPTEHQVELEYPEGRKFRRIEWLKEYHGS